MKHCLHTLNNSRNLLKICLFFFIFSTGSVLAQTQKGWDIDGANSNEWLGWSVSMGDANTFAASSPGNSASGAYSGAVKVFRFSGASWVQKGADILNPMGASGVFFQFGSSVSMPDANTVAVGSRVGFSGTSVATGHAAIYAWNGTNWVQKGQDLFGDNDGDNFGYSICMPDANTVIVGSPYNDELANNVGSIKVFTFDGTAWVQKGVTLYGEGADNFAGWSVSMPDANTLAFGAYANAGMGYLSGQVKIFTWNGTIWVPKGGDLAGEASEDMSGWSISMPDANTIAVGATGNDGNGAGSGHVRVHAWNGTNWVPKGADIDGEAAGDGFGYSVSMPNANTLAVGSINNQGNGTNSGHVRVYNWNGTVWVQNGVDIDGEEAGGQFGYSVSMKDPYSIAASAPYNDVIGMPTDRGHVRVYSFCTPTYSTISPTVCSSYTSPSGEFVWTQTGTYSEVIPNAAGCDSIIVINLTVGNLNVAVTNMDPSLTANLTGASYQWLDCNANYAEINGATSQTFTPSANGSYAVEITLNDCIDTSACQIISSLGLSVSEDIRILIFPNPSHDELNIETSNSCHFSLVGLEGRIITEGIINNSSKIDVQNLKMGVYILRFEGEQGQSVIRTFVKN